VQFILHFFSGARFQTLFKSRFEVTETGAAYHVKIKDSAIFSNYLSFKKCLDEIKPGKNVIFDFSEAVIVDHTLLEHLHHFEEDYHHGGGHVHMQGMGKHRANSDHPLATRKIAPERPDRIEFRLDKRQMQLRDFAEQFDFTFYPMISRAMAKYKDFPIETGSKVMYEENILSKYTDYGKIEISDIQVTDGAGSARQDSVMTVFLISDLEFAIPNFALEPERLLTKFFEHTWGKDIDFRNHPDFSKKYYLRADNENEVRGFFTARLIAFLETQADVHIESQRGKLLIYDKREKLSSEEIQSVLFFVEGFVHQLSKIEPQPA
jgi:hypothetical protein